MTRGNRPAAMPAFAPTEAASGRATGAAELNVGAALPDPPFEFIGPDGPAGFDIALMQHIAAKLGRTSKLVRYTGADFNGIFGGLDTGAYDCIASGTTITPAREKVADFCAPYAVSGQSLVVDTTRHARVHGIDDLAGLVIGVQHGNTSEPVAEKLVADHRAARVRVYAYNEIEKVLDDLSTGGCDALMKLVPVTAWFVRDRPNLKVVQVGITTERLGICVRKGDADLRAAIDKAQAKLTADGTLAALVAEWLGAGARLPG
jgi:polar amino acid transport system substrate-binding protein